MSSEAEISHVSDTALMVAACRALESARPDGLVQDPFAARLAGERGMAILRGQDRASMLTFGVGIRSRFLDELLMGLLRAGSPTTVLCLGAGLDTRPWRLDLPEGTRWVEADFPAMLEYKAAVMAGTEPKCPLERVGADLRDPVGRAAVFAAIGKGRAILITEGLLMYLAGATIEALAAEAAQTGVTHWLMEMASPEMVRRMGILKGFENVRAEGHIDGVQTIAVLEKYGWRREQFRNYQADLWAAAPERVTAFKQEREAAGAPPIEPAPADDPSGIYVFGRAK